MSVPTYQGPGRYRHYKGGEYEVLGLALQEDTVDKTVVPFREGQPGAKLAPEIVFVIYHPLTPGSLLERRAEDFWARELGDFNAMVEREHGPVPRFVKEA
jgi:hypothetical protein